MADIEYRPFGTSVYQHDLGPEVGFGSPSMREIAQCRDSDAASWLADLLNDRLALRATSRMWMDVASAARAKHRCGGRVESCDNVELCNALRALSGFSAQHEGKHE